MIELAAKPVALVGGGAELGQPLERGAELVLEPVTLSGQLAQLPGVPLQRLVEGGADLVELRARLLMLFPQPGQLLLS